MSLYCEHKFVVNVLDPITCFIVLCNGPVFFREGLMMIPRDSKHVTQDQYITDYMCVVFE